MLRVIISHPSAAEHGLLVTRRWLEDPDEGEYGMTQEAAKMPEVPFGPHKISRLIVGSNQQGGASHQSRELDMHMLDYFTEDQTLAFVRDCLAQGIDSWQVNYGPKFRAVVQRLREEGEDIKVIPNSAPRVPDLSLERMRPMLDRIESSWDEMLEAFKPVGVYLWGMLTDILWREGKIDTAKDFLAKARDAGVQVGVGTHIPEVIEYIDEKGWDIDFYLASVYKWMKSNDEILAIMPEVPVDGHGGWEVYMPSEPARMCETIRRTPKMCFAFKVFAGGRACRTPQQVSDVFEFILGNIKPTDAVIVGMYPRFAPKMIEENADLVKKYG